MHVNWSGVCSAPVPLPLAHFLELRHRSLTQLVLESSCPIGPGIGAPCKFPDQVGVSTLAPARLWTGKRNSKELSQR